MKCRAMARGWVGFVALGMAGLAGCSHPGPPAASAPSSAMAPSVGSEEPGGRMPAAAAVAEVHVNQDCLLLQDTVDGIRGMSVPGGQMLRGGGESDPVVCRLESKLSSNHVQRSVVQGTVQSSVMVVQQQQYLLQNPFAEPVVFVVEHAVPEGWVVDSVPRPTAMEGHTAIFKVVVQPGQFARLHVAEEHSIMLAPPTGE
ncbi:MAG: hypothetical protein ACP5E5_06665 [Acidobacteriaceae bacterium]